MPSSIARADFDHGIARIVPRLADRDLLDAKLPAAGRDRIQHLRQDQAVDDVPGNLDFLDDRKIARIHLRLILLGLVGHTVSLTALHLSGIREKRYTVAF